MRYKTISLSQNTYQEVSKVSTHLSIQYQDVRELPYVCQAMKTQRELKNILLCNQYHCNHQGKFFKTKDRYIMKFNSLYTKKKYTNILFNYFLPPSTTVKEVPTIDY